MESEQLNYGLKNPYVKRLQFRRLVERIEGLEKRIDILEKRLQEPKKSTKKEVKQDA
jgi:hypothetical protein